MINLFFLAPHAHLQSNRNYTFRATLFSLGQFRFRSSIHFFKASGVSNFGAFGGTIPSGRIGLVSGLECNSTMIR